MRRRDPAPSAVRLRLAAALLLAAFPLVGCDEDADDETFETPNEVDGTPTPESSPEGTVDSTDGGA